MIPHHEFQARLKKISKNNPIATMLAVDAGKDTKKVLEDIVEAIKTSKWGLSSELVLECMEFGEGLMRKARNTPGMFGYFQFMMISIGTFARIAQAIGMDEQRESVEKTKRN